MAESAPSELGIIRGGDASDTTGWGVAWAVILVGGGIFGAVLGLLTGGVLVWPLWRVPNSAGLDGQADTVMNSEDGTS
jgi:hypothetical protein